MTIRLFFLIYFLLLLVAPASALQTDSVSVAIDIVDEFASSVVSDIGGDPATELIQRKKAKAVDELENLKLTQPPSEKRYREARRIAEAFMDDARRTLQERLERRHEERKVIERTMSENGRLKASLLSRLDASLKYETYGQKPAAPAPSAEDKPIDTPPGEPAGLMYR